MASTLVALQTVTVGAGGAASVTFSSIPQTYTDLVVKISARSTGSADDNMRLNFNNSSTIINYNRNLWGNGSSALSESVSGSDKLIGDYASGYLPNSSTTASTFGNFEITIPNYTVSTYKSVSIDNVSENNSASTYIRTSLGAGLWQNTDAITSIVITNFNNFTQYSTFTLYGVYKSPLDTAVEAPTIGTATAASTGANVAFTPSGTGAPATSYVATSSPGGISATGYTSPILVTGLTSGTAYTFTVRGQNPGGTGASSAASNSVTPYDGYESIATVYGTGSSNTIIFSSIPSTYQHLQIRSLSKTTTAGTANATYTLQFNSDTGSNYTRHALVGDGATVSASGAANQTSIRAGGNTEANSTNIFAVSIVDILDYANTNKYKTLRTLFGSDLNGSGEINLRSGVWMNTSAVTSITLTTSSGNFASGTVIELYGIR